MLGSLEQAVLNVIWKSTGCTVKQVKESLDGTTSSETVRTTLTRLMGKGLVRTRGRNPCYVYVATKTQADLELDLASALVRQVEHNSWVTPESLLLAFIELADAHKLFTLEVLISHKRRKDRICGQEQMRSSSNIEMEDTRIRL